MTGLLTVTHFLVSLVFSLFLFVLWIRLFLRYYRVSTLHPVSQVIYRFTNPLLSPVEKLFYPKKKPLPRYDWTCLALIIIVEFIKFTLLGLLIYKTVLPILYLTIFVLADLIIQPCNLLFYALLIRIIMSWINPQWRQNPAADILIYITEPLINMGRKIIPDISGFDFAPFIIMIILKVITLFIEASMPIPLV